MVSFRLLVLRSARLEEVRAFYERLGLVFVTEQHGSGPVHHAARVGAVVLELYPLAAEASPDGQLRLGFAVENLTATLDALTESEIISPMRESLWGLRAVVRDPEGRVVELTQG
jgi:hypothetical protein